MNIDEFCKFELFLCQNLMATINIYITLWHTSQFVCTGRSIRVVPPLCLHTLVAMTTTQVELFPEALGSQGEHRS